MVRCKCIEWILFFMALKVYGIPNCGTCKKALAWLDKNGVGYEFIDTKAQAPSRQMIAQWVAALGAKPMRNTSGQSYRALGDAKADWSDEQWIDAFAQDAMLLKRPLFEKAGTAVLVGFRAKEEELRSVML
jgi:arsenate reductase (glutaredoxin)